VKASPVGSGSITVRVVAPVFGSTRETLIVSTARGEPSQVVVLPGNSVLPFLLAVGTSIPLAFSNLFNLQFACETQVLAMAGHAAPGAQ